MKLRAITLAAVLAAAAVGAQAQSQTATFQWTAYHWGTGTDLSLYGNSLPNTYAAEIIGNLTLNGSALGSFAAFCIEVDSTFYSPLTGLVGPLGAAESNQISRLLTGAGWSSSGWQTDSIANNASATFTAIQLGIWEIVYDYASNGFDLSNGDFQVVNPSLASSYASTIAGFVANGNTSMASSLIGISDNQLTLNNRQDILVAVPEPSAYALMLSGLAAVGFLARRRGPQSRRP